ncbi:37S ribosomal protein S19, mitochondrial [Cytospora mali]|uniref:37S ribosomal protein S19, mitochondrial n=1 Tax=Cytospora mali TaxID=578113 RepID=A0A194VTS5_CYTMA|nr:37S ribosomal protein S19, mitochondrial [Valsa mali]
MFPQSNQQLNHPRPFSTAQDAAHEDITKAIGPHIVPLPLVRPQEGKYTPPIRTQARSATVLPSFVGLTFEVYNGKVYNPVTIMEDMVGHKLGEFSQYVQLTDSWEEDVPGGGPQAGMDGIDD